MKVKFAFTFILLVCRHAGAHSNIFHETKLDRVRLFLVKVFLYLSWQESYKIHSRHIKHSFLLKFYILTKIVF